MPPLAKHIEKILALLDEVMRFQSVNPKLPWSTRTTDAEDG
jgi:hypothetical protein